MNPQTEEVEPQITQMTRIKTKAFFFICEICVICGSNVFIRVDSCRFVDQAF